MPWAVIPCLCFPAPPCWRHAPCLLRAPQLPPGSTDPAGSLLPPFLPPTPCGPPPCPRCPPTRHPPLPPVPADYSSNLGDFLAENSLGDLSQVSSVQELAAAAKSIEDAFCTPERSACLPWALTARRLACCHAPRIPQVSLARRLTLARKDAFELSSGSGGQPALPHPWPLAFPAVSTPHPLPQRRARPALLLTCPHLPFFPPAASPPPRRCPPPAPGPRW